VPNVSISILAASEFAPTICKPVPASGDGAAEFRSTVISPEVVRDVSVPTLVRDESVTPEGNVVPVNPLAGTAAAVIDVLHWNPAALCHSSALPAA
jgi:hypothetical protein